MKDIPIENAIAFRMKKHSLAKPLPKKEMAEAVGVIGGVQAQVYQAGQSSIGARVSGITVSDIDDALWHDKSLVKTWAMRSTMHLVPADDLPIYVGALSTNIEMIFKWGDRAGLTASEIEARLKEISNLLKNGPCTRKALLDKLDKSRESIDNKWILHGWGGAMKIAVMRGDMLFGPPEGQEITFVLRRNWLKSFKPMPRKKALGEFLRLYLGAYGPATSTDFLYWSGLKSAHAREAFDAIAGDIEEVTIGGKKAFVRKQDLTLLAKGPSKKTIVNMLPNFDVFLLGHRDKSHLVDDAHYKAVYRKAGWISAVILLNGRVAGVWKAEPKGKTLAMKVEPFAKLSIEVQKLVETEAQQIAAFKGFTNGAKIEF